MGTPLHYGYGQGAERVTSATNVPFKTEAKKIFDQRVYTLSKDDPEGHCLPPGVPRVMYTPHPMEFLQLPNRIVIIYEIGTLWRIVWMDGRQHPTDPNPTFLGDSIGHWEGDTLVVDVVGFNTRTWLELAGHPHGEKLHVIEKFSRPDFNTLHYEATIDDPEYYTEPWTVSDEHTVGRRPGTERVRLPGKQSGPRAPGWETNY